MSDYASLIRPARDRQPFVGRISRRRNPTTRGHCEGCQLIELSPNGIPPTARAPVIGLTTRMYLYFLSNIQLLKMEMQQETPRSDLLVAASGGLQEAPGHRPAGYEASGKTTLAQVARFRLKIRILNPNFHGKMRRCLSAPSTCNNWRPRSPAPRSPRCSGRASAARRPSPAARRDARVDQLRPRVGAGRSPAHQPRAGSLGSHGTRRPGRDPAHATALQRAPGSRGPSRETSTLSHPRQRVAGTDPRGLGIARRPGRVHRARRVRPLRNGKRGMAHALGTGRVSALVPGRVRGRQPGVARGVHSHVPGAGHPAARHHDPLRRHASILDHARALARPDLERIRTGAFDVPVGQDRTALPGPLDGNLHGAPVAALVRERGKTTGEGAEGSIFATRACCIPCWTFTATVPCSRTRAWAHPGRDSSSTRSCARYVRRAPGSGAPTAAASSISS